ncbi:helix-turn-helix domain-containing protein [Azotobacter sp. CWF10]
MTRPHRDSVADELAAFANGIGGVLLLGVNDKTRDVEGIECEQLDTVELWLTNMASQAIDPPLPIETRRVEIPDRQGNLRPLVWVRVAKGLFVHRSPTATSTGSAPASGRCRPNCSPGYSSSAAWCG